MLIVEDPLRLLYIALGILIILLLIIKFSEFVGKFESKAKKKKESKPAPTKEEKPKEDKPKEEESKEESKKPSSPEVSDNSNYLYDRFAVNPTIDDADCYKKSISEAFLTEEKYREIRNNKVDIRVEKVGSDLYKNNIQNRIRELTNNNRTEKEKLLNEFNNLSTEMKLLLIENIMQNID